MKFYIIESTLLEQNKTEHESGLSQLIAIFDDLFKKCNFVIAELSSVIQNEGEVEAPSKELAKHALTAMADKGTGLEITSESIQEWIKSFMDGRPTAVAIDLNNELALYSKKEGNKSVSKSISKTENTEKPKKIENDADSDVFIKQLKGTIELYEKVLAEQTQKGEDTGATNKLLSSLRKQLADYLKQKNNQFGNLLNEKPKKPLTKEEKRSRALEEIFYFYSRQRFNPNGKKTFEVLEEEQNQLTVAYFIKFLKDFGFSFDTTTVKAVFARTAIAGKYIDLASFKTMIERTAVALQKFKVDELTKEKKQLNKELAILKQKQEEPQQVPKEPMPGEQIQEPENKEGEQIIEEVQKPIESMAPQEENQAQNEEKKIEIKTEKTGNTVDKLKMDINNLKAEILKLKAEKEEDIVETIYKKIEIDDPTKYRKKMAGFEIKAFFTREKETGRIPKDKPKIPPPDYKPYIPGENKMKKQEKANNKSHDPLLMELPPAKPKRVIPKIPSAAVLKNPLQHNKEGGYSQRWIPAKEAPKPIPGGIVKQVPEIPKKDPTPKKLTWNGLEGISYKDIKGNEGFDPAALLVDDESQEDPELANILGKFQGETGKNGVSPKMYF